MIEEEKIERLMYSYDDWNTVAKGKTPNYFFQIEKNGQALHYFGTTHSRDITNPQYGAIREHWQEFLKRGYGTNAVAIVEGGVRTVHESEEVAVEKDQDPGFITFLAAQASVPAFSPEPSREAVCTFVSKKTSEEALDCYYLARIAHAWHGRKEPKPPLERYLIRNAPARFVSEGDEAFSFTEANRIWQKILGRPFDREGIEFLALLINPTKAENPLRDTVRATSTYRNIHIVQEIVRLYKEGKNIFVVYGGAHAILQEPALRELL